MHYKLLYVADLMAFTLMCKFKICLIIFSDKKRYKNEEI